MKMKKLIGPIILALVLAAALLYQAYEARYRLPAPVGALHFENGNVIWGKPLRGADFIVAVQPGAPAAAVYECMDQVHRLGGGLCGIYPGVFAREHHQSVYRRYDDVSLYVVGE
jgi:hypothetical protein